MTHSSRRPGAFHFGNSLFEPQDVTDPLSAVIGGAYIEQSHALIMVIIA